MLYTIEDTTLTAIGDAVREKHFLIPETFNFILERDDSTSRNTVYFTNSKSKHRLIISGVGTNISDARSFYITENDARGTQLFNTTFTSIATEFTTELIVSCPAVYFLFNTASFFADSVEINMTAIPVDENGNEYKYTPLEMAEAIGELNTETSRKFILAAQGANTTKYTITPKDLEGATKIGSHAFYQNELTEVELPNTVIDVEQSAFQYCDQLMKVILPASITTLRANAFSHGSVSEVRILNDTSVISVPITNMDINSPFASTPADCVFYIPSKLYNDYWNDVYWSKHRHQFVPVGEWVFDPKINAVLLFNGAKEVSIQLSEFATTPQFTITSSNESVATITNVSINEDNTLLTFTINSLTTEGTSNIEINIMGENTYNFVGTVIVYETIPESTYEIIPQVEGASYGFTLREDGYWESQNFKAKNSAAVCQININNAIGRQVYIDCINYAESNYDYGILGSVGQQLTTTNSDDGGVKESFKGKSKNEVQTITYDDAIGNCFIQIKYKKDTSGDQNNDSLRFKVRFSE